MMCKHFEVANANIKPYMMNLILLFVSMPEARYVSFHAFTFCNLILGSTPFGFRNPYMLPMGMTRSLIIRVYKLFQYQTFLFKNPKDHDKEFLKSKT